MQFDLAHWAVQKTRRTYHPSLFALPQAYNRRQERRRGKGTRKKEEKTRNGEKKGREGLSLPKNENGNLRMIFYSFFQGFLFALWH